MKNVFVKKVNSYFFLSKCVPCRFFCVIIIFIFNIVFFEIDIARAQIKGDVELLKAVADTHKSNMDKVITWQGKAEISDRNIDANELTYQMNSSASFYYDSSQNARRWQWIVNDYRKKSENGFVGDESQLETEDEMIKPDGYYRMTRGYQKLPSMEWERTLVIWPPDVVDSVVQSTVTSRSFDPLWYFSLRGHSVYSRLMSFYEKADVETLSNVNVTREGDIVTVKLGSEETVVVNIYKFDLNRGGNVVLFYIDDGNVIWRCEYDYTKVDDIWIPVGYKHRIESKTADDIISVTQREVKFIEYQINEKIEPAEFSIEAMGLLDDTIVTDRRSERFAKIKPLSGKAIPEMNGVDIAFSDENYEGKKLLICFWDLEQRPSRNCMTQLTKRIEQLKENNIEVIAIHASRIEKDILEEWLKENDINFTVGMVKDEPSASLDTSKEKTLFNWGVKALPWLILTDEKHIVKEEGFAVSELDEMILASEISIDELIDKIDAGQKNNSLLITHMKGEFTSRNVETPAGQQRNYEQMLSLGEKVAEGPFVENSINQFSSFIVFDDQKIKYGTEGHKYLFNGKEAYELVSGKNSSQVYIIDPKKINERKSFADPRDWTYLNSSTLKKWLGNLKEDFDLNVEELSESQQKRYIVRIKYKSGFVHTFHIDPNKGWHILKAELVDSNNKLRSDFILDVIKTPKGGWLAKKSVRSLYRAMDNNSDAVLLNTQEAILDKASFEAIDPNEFTLLGFGVPPGTHVWDELKDIIYVVETYSSANMFPLTGKILPDLNDFGINLSPNDNNGKMILVCFFDYEQRLSRNCILELNKKAAELKEKDIKIIAVQTSKIENNVLDEWVKENNIDFPVGMIREDVEQTKFNWGVQAWPWLILTDKKHIVQAEGFSVSEIEEKIK